jgi:hypothetical protein
MKIKKYLPASPDIFFIEIEIENQTNSLSRLPKSVQVRHVIHPVLHTTT